MDLVFLIGYRGSGKSAVARLLAERLGWGWCDADAVLEERHNRSIRQIFAEEGEAGFRDKEAAILEELARMEKQVVATGGGIILRPENRTILRAGKVVWLTAPAGVLWERMQEDPTTAQRRPNLAQGGFAEIEANLRMRSPLYAACADWIVDTGAASPQEAADAVYRWLEST
jgi:shikimate kinase